MFLDAPTGHAITAVPRLSAAKQTLDAYITAPSANFRLSSTMQKPSIPPMTMAGKVIDTLPECPGVYRFLDADGQALYIGKSINLRTRVRTHIANAKKSSRQMRMVAGSARIDLRPTAGEVGALLLENEAIKQQLPIFNKRQRNMRRMWSFTLGDNSAGFTVPSLQAYATERPDILATYGAYANRSHARKSLQSLARREQLCPQVLGLEAGKGPCFQFQIGRCDGACNGQESARAHNQRLLAALNNQRLSAWPVTRPILLHETADNPALQPAKEWHLLHNWTYLGTFDSVEGARTAKVAPAFMFDKDTYHILKRTLKRQQLPLLCAETLKPVEWPGLSQTQ
jgi:excinuclease Cho